MDVITHPEDDHDDFEANASDREVDQAQQERDGKEDDADCMESDKPEDYVTQRAQSDENHDYDVNDLDYLGRYESAKADVEERRQEALRASGTLRRERHPMHPALSGVTRSLRGFGTVRLGLSISWISHCLIPLQGVRGLAALPSRLRQQSRYWACALS